jgi:hypothetical protein
LIVVYIVWGSTYLAIRITVSGGGGFPPFTMGLWRVLLAGGYCCCGLGCAGSASAPRAVS